MYFLMEESLVNFPAELRRMKKKDSFCRGKYRTFTTSLHQRLESTLKFFPYRETTTLNPLSFGDPPPATTQNPVQQQLADEQRRFQQEIADHGLREQQQQSFGVPRPRTTTPPPQPQFNPAAEQFDQPDQSFYDDPSLSPSPAPQIPQAYDPYADYNPEQGYYPTIREFRSTGRKYRRSIDRQLASHNDLGYFSSTASPQSYFNNLVQHSTPKQDFSQISNWLIDNLTKQVQKNIAQLTNGASKRYQHSTPKPTSGYGLFSTASPKPTPIGLHYSSEAPYYSTMQPTPSGSHYLSEADKSNFGYQYSTESPKPTPFGFQYSTETPMPTPNFGLHYSTETPMQSPVYQPISFDQSSPKSIDVTPYPNWNNVRNINTPSTINYIDNFEAKKLQPFDDFESKKIKSVQILPYSTDQPSYSITVKPYDNNVYQAYKQVYDIDHQTIKPVTSTVPNIDVPSFLQIINNQPSPDTVSVTSLFKSKLHELKEHEKSNRQAPQFDPQTEFADFQQHNRFFDQLSNTLDAHNYTDNTTAPYDTNSPNAIFIKVPQDTPSSTVGFLFDKTITKNVHKKENSPTKNKSNNRSAQLIKSSLVYRTPPGKRATVSRSEITQSNQVDTGLLTNFLLGDTGKPLKWLLGNTQTTTSRPFVTALLNLIRKRATSESA